MSSFAVRMHSKMPLGLKTLIFQMVHKFKFNICRKGVTRHDEELLQCFDKHGLLSICMCVGRGRASTGRRNSWGTGLGDGECITQQSGSSSSFFRE